MIVGLGDFGPFLKNFQKRVSRFLNPEINLYANKRQSRIFKFWNILLSGIILRTKCQANFYNCQAKCYNCQANIYNCQANVYNCQASFYNCQAKFYDSQIFLIVRQKRIGRFILFRFVSFKLPVRHREKNFNLPN